MECMGEVAADDLARGALTAWFVPCANINRGAALINTNKNFGSTRAAGARVGAPRGTPRHLFAAKLNKKLANSVWQTDPRMEAR